MRLVAVICALFLFSSCGKEPTGIPYVPVDYRISITEFDQKSVNGTMVDRGGVAGLIIHRSAFGNGYLAFDRCSSVNPEQKCAITIDESGLTATDPCSKAVFSLEDGSPQKAPAKKNLRQYEVTVINNFIIQVRN